MVRLRLFLARFLAVMSKNEDLNALELSIVNTLMNILSICTIRLSTRI